MPPDIFIVFMSIAQIGLGLAAGIWWCRRNFGLSDSASQLDAPGIRQLIGKIQSVAAHMANDVGEHSDRLNESSHRIATARAKQDDQPDLQEVSVLTDVVVGVVKEVVGFNGELQQKLCSAESRIQEQSEQISTYLSEARTDPLTELGNRRMFDDALARCVAQKNRRGTSVSLMFLDVDHFKKLNDLHGHVAGDSVLRSLVRVIKETMREIDQVTRFGGEEFAVVMPGANIDEAKLAASRIRQAVVDAAFLYEKTRLSVTVSVGVAEMLSGEDVDLLLARADEAVYASKEAGRDSAHYHDGDCVRLVSNDRRAAAVSSFADVDLPSTKFDSPTVSEAVGSELAEVCSELRQRVAEITKSRRHRTPK